MTHVGIPMSLYDIVVGHLFTLAGSDTGEVYELANTLATHKLFTRPMNVNGSLTIPVALDTFALGLVELAMMRLGASFVNVSGNRI